MYFRSSCLYIFLILCKLLKYSKEQRDTGTAISSAVKSGIPNGSNGGGNNVRSLTAEEIKMAQFVSRRVQAALEKQKSVGVSNSESADIPPPEPAVPKMKPTPPTAKLTPPRTKTLVTDSLTELKQDKVTSARVTSTPPAVERRDLVPRDTNVSPTGGYAHHEMNSGSIDDGRESGSDIGNDGREQKVKALTRKLSAEDLPIIGRALQLAVKHRCSKRYTHYNIAYNLLTICVISINCRGGGPFGAGRLRGEDVTELQEALLQAYEVLQTDATAAELETGAHDAAIEYSRLLSSAGQILSTAQPEVDMTAVVQSESVNPPTKQIPTVQSTMQQQLKEVLSASTDGGDASTQAAVTTGAAGGATTAAGIASAPALRLDRFYRARHTLRAEVNLLW